MRKSNPINPVTAATMYSGDKGVFGADGGAAVFRASGVGDGSSISLDGTGVGTGSGDIGAWAMEVATIGLAGAVAAGMGDG